MISATELRKIQESNLAARKEQAEKRDTEFKARFEKACDKYYERLLEEVDLALKHVRDKRLNYSYIMLDHKYLTKDVEGLTYTTVLYGFWNKDTKKFNDEVFAKHEVKKPLERAAEELAKHGYKLEDVSDHEKSKRLYIKLSW